MSMALHGMLRCFDAIFGLRRGRNGAVTMKGAATAMFLSAKTTE